MKRIINHKILLVIPVVVILALGVYLFNQHRSKSKKVENNYKLTGKQVNLMYDHELQYFLTCVQNRQTPMNNFYESAEILKTAINIKSRSMA